MIDKLDYGVWKLRTGMSSFYLQFQAVSVSEMEISSKRFALGEVGENGHEAREEGEEREGGEKGRRRRKSKLILQNEILNSLNSISQNGSS